MRYFDVATQCPGSFSLKISDLSRAWRGPLRAQEVYA